MNKTLILFTFILFNAVYNDLRAQVSVPTNAISSGQYVGSSTPIDVVYKAAGSQYGVLSSSNGYWGFGPSFTPNFRMDVDAGDINISSFTNAYRIGDGSNGSSYKVLWHNGQIAGVF